MGLNGYEGDPNCDSAALRETFLEQNCSWAKPNPSLVIRNTFIFARRDAEAQFTFQMISITS